jgi:hypothetical protein
MQVSDQPSQKSKSSGRKLGCAFWLLPLGTVAMIVLGIWYTYTSYRFSTNGVEVESTVVRLESSSSSEGGTTYSPVYSYTVNGQKYEYESVNSSNPPAHEVGEQVTLLYDPAHPDKARVNSFFEMWLVPIIICPVSVVMLVLSIGIPLLVRRM